MYIVITSIILSGEGKEDINCACMLVYIEGSVTQRRYSILAILRKSGLCVTEHLGPKELSLCFNGVLGGVKSLCCLESPHFSEHFDIKYSFW